MCSGSSRAPISSIAWCATSSPSGAAARARCRIVPRSITPGPSFTGRRAPDGSGRAPLFRGGGKAFGPKPRSHAIALPKKVRALALKHALSAKAKSDTLVVIDKCELKEAKTKELKVRCSKLGLGSVLISDGAAVQHALAKAARTLPGVDVLPVAGI